MTSEKAAVGLFRAPAAYMTLSMGRYATELAAALRSLNDPNLAFREFSPQDAWLLRYCRARPRLSRIAGHAARFPHYMARARATRFDINHVLDHAYGQLAYVLDQRRTVVTCHDLYPLLVWRGAIPGLSRRRVPPVTVGLSFTGLRRSAAVITPSSATKRAVVETGYPEDRVFVIPHGVESRFRTGASRPARITDARVLLNVDTGSPYKNQRASVEVLARAAEHIDSVKLVRVGRPLPAAERERARRYGVQGLITELGRIPERELPALYSSCDVLLFPSFYEGFGWPVLEAMACGTPVVVSRWETLREIAGARVPAADASDYDGLADHVVRIFQQDRLARELSDYGIERSRAFTWRRAAEATRLVYATVAEMPVESIERPTANVEP